MYKRVDHDYFSLFGHKKSLFPGWEKASLQRLLLYVLQYTFTQQHCGTATTGVTTAGSDIGVDVFHLSLLTPLRGFSFLNVRYFLDESSLLLASHVKNTLASRLRC